MKVNELYINANVHMKVVSVQFGISQWWDMQQKVERYTTDHLSCNVRLSAASQD